MNILTKKPKQPKAPKPVKLKKEKIPKEPKAKKEHRKVIPPVSEWLVVPEWNGICFDKHQKRTLVKRIIVIVILLALVITSFVCAQNVYRESKDTFPNAIVFRSSYGLSNTFDKKAYDYCSRVSVTQALVTSDNPVLYDQVNLYYTEDNYDEYVPFDMIAGAYFFLKDYPQQNRVAVISDKLAVSHFKTTEAVGQKLDINGTEYMVCGVYRSKDDLLTQYSTNGYDSVYVPYKSVENVKQLPVHFMLMSTDITEFTKAALSAMVTKTQIYLFPEHITGYHDLLNLMAFLRQLVVFLMGVTVIVLLCVQFKRNCVTAYGFFRTEYQKKNGTWYAIKAVLFLLIAVGLFLLVKFELKIPQSILPDNNIFDLGHYFGEILSAVQSRNAVMLYDFHWNYCFNALAAYGAWLVAAAVLFGVLVVKVMSLIGWLKRVYEEE